MVLRKCFLKALGLPSLDGHWKDAEGALVSLFGLVDPGGFKGSCSLLWYVRGPGGIDNIDSDCVSWSLQPSYSPT